MPRAGTGVVKAYQDADQETRKGILDGLPYEVGSLKPPRQHRFKPGNKSGRGRPRASKNLTTQIREALEMKVTINENGRTKKVAASEASLKQLAVRSARGDTKAIALLLDLARKTGLLDTEPEAAESILTAHNAEIWQQVISLLSRAQPVAGNPDEPKKDKE